VIADVIRCHAVRHALDAIPIPIIHIRRRVCADGDAGQTILGVVGERVAARRASRVRCAAFRQVAVRVPSCFGINSTVIRAANLRDRVLVRRVIVLIRHIPVVIVARQHVPNRTIRPTVRIDVRDAGAE